MLAERACDVQGERKQCPARYTARASRGPPTQCPLGETRRRSPWSIESCPKNRCDCPRHTTERLRSPPTASGDHPARARRPRPRRCPRLLTPGCCCGSESGPCCLNHHPSCQHRCRRRLNRCGGRFLRGADGSGVGGGQPGASPGSRDADLLERRLPHAHAAAQRALADRPAIPGDGRIVGQAGRRRRARRGPGAELHDPDRPQRVRVRSAPAVRSRSAAGPPPASGQRHRLRRRRRRGARPHAPDRRPDRHAGRCQRRDGHPHRLHRAHGHGRRRSPLQHPATGARRLPVAR